MAKCPKCLQRKGKRPCPALDTGICSQCCAEHRLNTIACPEDCEYLASEFYQQKRRRAKAAAQGRRFVEVINESFSNETRREFAFALQADLFYYMRQNGPAEDETVARILESLQAQSGRVVVVESAPHPLVPHLTERMSTARPYVALESKLSATDKEGCLDTLLRHVRSLSADGDGLRYYQELCDFFGSLDFEADLDYDPSQDEGSRDPRSGNTGSGRSEGGIILPG